MSRDQAFQWLPFVTLAAFFVISRLRARALRRLGERVVVVDRQRPWTDILYDTVLIVVFLFWFYLLVAEVSPLPLRWLPGWLTTKAVDSTAGEFLGAVLLVAAPVLFGAALRSLGTSWRMGVDREKPGPLVTTGVYAWTRNPIYTAFDLVFFGTLFVHGRVIYFFVVAVLALLLHGIALREERFLAERYGEVFGEYCRRVPRYGFPWCGKVP